ncbi:hypothetical protein DPMN_007503 [Dreissena polymorpha]|uniref:Uncharacterized protein n=1 Tax=Dreissena polymorpha TaxID=45954 RepID=A0A9D4RWH2_DREPO|nr:hypothetical protein DPMN_007503 [Dreissena polymorpha]
MPSSLLLWYQGEPWAAKRTSVYDALPITLTICTFSMSGCESEPYSFLANSFWNLM